jgi:hypothetical protein
VIEIYMAARQLAATGNVLAQQATEDIEREMGGPIEQRPEAYTTRAVVRRADDVAASGVKGVTPRLRPAVGLPALRRDAALP